MSEWRVQSIDDIPSVELAAWSIFRVQLAGKSGPTTHLVGTRIQNPFGKVSSAIISVDTRHRLIRTESGTIYELVGEHGYSEGGDLTRERWMAVNKLSSFEDVTEEFLKMFG